MSFHKHLIISSIIIFSLFIVQSVSATTPPNSPKQLTPAHNATWSDAQAVSAGNITFTWQNNGDAEGNPLWFYFYLIKRNGTAWAIDTTTYTSAVGVTTYTKNLTAGSYAWQVAAVDATQSSDPWHKWADLNQDGQVTSADWSFLVVKASITTAGKKMLSDGHSEKNATFLSQSGNKAYINTLDFSGATIDINLVSGAPLKKRVFRKDLPPVKYSDVSEEISRLANRPSKWTDAFLSIDCSNGKLNDTIDWFGTATVWDTILSNIELVGQIAQESGLRGVWFDCETYNSQNAWWFNELNPKYPGHTYSEWKNQVRLRGRQIMERLVSKYPNIRVGFRQGLNYVWVEETKKGGSFAIQGANKREFIPAFVNGMLEGLPASGGADLIEYAAGENYFGGFKRSPAQNSLFDEIWNNLKPNGNLSNNPNYIFPANKSKFDSKYKIGFMIWFDGADSPGEDGTYWTNDGSQLSLNTWTPSQFNAWLTRCLYSGYTTVQYCTTWINQSDDSPGGVPDWWVSGGINSQYIDVVNNLF